MDPPAMEGHSAPKRAACLACKRSKMKCILDASSKHTSCMRCVQRGTTCIIPAYHIGRNRGSKNKRSGIEKAVSQLEEALDHNDDSNTLHHFLTRVQSHRHQPSHSRRPQPSPNRHGPDDLCILAAEHPLLLLAQTSDMISPEPMALAPSPTAPSLQDAERFQQYHGSFFGPFVPVHDVQPDLDPIALGLVDMEQARTLFAFYYQNLAHTRWGLDPVIHTPQFVHKQSAFLFTTVLAVATLFIQTASALSVRLRLHCRKLADLVISRRMRSVEIILAFMINVPWMSPGTHWADDESWFYISAASTIALDLFLEKTIIHSQTDPAIVEWSHAHSSECVDARKVMALDGFSHVDVTSNWGLRLLRRRERVWLTLWGLERGVCLARGRRHSLPVTASLQMCDSWHDSSIADIWDSSITSAIVLRRDLAPMVDKVKASCDEPGGNAEQPSKLIEQFFQEWITKCPFHSGNGLPGIENPIPPYVDILATHTRLSVYGNLINHPNSSTAVRKIFHTTGLSASLNVLRAAVRGEKELMTMPNNTVIMVSFAAVFAVQISLKMGNGAQPLVPSVSILIQEVADVLERIGDITPHRSGISTLFAAQLRHVVRLVSQATIQPTDEPPHSTLSMPTSPVANDFQWDVSLGAEQQSVQFSDMSVEQINDMIDTMGQGLEQRWDDLDLNFPEVDWMDMMSLGFNAI